MKPPGVGFAISGGAVVLRVTKSSRTLDAIWDAVQRAIEDGMTPEEFKREAAEAWAHELKEAAKHAASVLNR